MNGILKNYNTKEKEWIKDIKINEKKEKELFMWIKTICI